MSDVEIGMGLDMGDVAKALARMPEMTSKEAEKAVRQLTATFDQAKRETVKLRKQIEKENRAAAHSFEDLGDTAGDAESSIRAISGAIGMISPEAEAALNVVAELNGAFEGLTKGSGVLNSLGIGMASLGPIALGAAAAAAILGSAYLVLADELERADAKVKAVAASTERLSTAHGRFSDVVDGVSADLEKMVGTYDVVAEAQQKRDRDIRQAAAAERRAADSIVATAEAQKAQARTFDEIARAEQAVNVARTQRDRILQGVNDKEAKALEQSAQLAEYQGELADEEERLAEKQKRAEEARLAAAQAARAEADASREAAEAARDHAQALAELEAGFAALDRAESIVSRLTDHRLSELERIDKAEKEALDSLYETHVASQEQIQAVREEFAQRRIDLEEETARKAAENAQEMAEATRRLQSESLQDVLSVTQMTADGIAEAMGGAYERLTEDVVRSMDYRAAAEEHLTESQKRQLDRRIDAQKRAARNAFDAQQTAAAASAAVQTSVAVTQALASAPWPLSLVPAGAALAAGLQEQRAIATTRPSFHVGGSISAASGAPDEVDITARDGEYMLNPTGRQLIGEQTLDRANAGQRPTGDRIVVVNQYKHNRMVDQWKEDGLSAGDPISKAIRTGKMVGHRSGR